MVHLNQVMKAFIVVTLALMCALSCTADPGDPAKLDCQQDVLCNGEGGMFCCPTDMPYCGQPGTTCPVGECCSSPPVGN